LFRSSISLVWRRISAFIFLSVAMFFVFAMLEQNGAEQRAPARIVEVIVQPRSELASVPLYGPGSDYTSRTFFPYSIVPGGVESVQELKNAVAHDPMVAAHYADFDLSRARVAVVERDRAVYVSYRLGNRVYWMTKTLQLHQGETIITDGKNEARTRCGNRISDIPINLVAPIEPRVDAMDGTAPILTVENQLPPAFPQALLARNLGLAPGLAPFVEGPSSLSETPGGPATGGEIIPPAYFPIVGGGGGGSPSPEIPIVPIVPVIPPVATPEPGTLILSSIGLLALGGIYGLVRGYRKVRV
jgi:hypothetical protein